MSQYFEKKKRELKQLANKSQAGGYRKRKSKNKNSKKKKRSSKKRSSNKNKKSKRSRRKSKKKILRGGMEGASSSSARDLREQAEAQLSKIGDAPWGDSAPTRLSSATGPGGSSRARSSRRPSSRSTVLGSTDSASGAGRPYRVVSSRARSSRRPTVRGSTGSATVAPRSYRVASSTARSSPTDRRRQPASTSRSYEYDPYEDSSDDDEPYPASSSEVDSLHQTYADLKRREEDLFTRMAAQDKKDKKLRRDIAEADRMGEDLDDRLAAQAVEDARLVRNISSFRGLGEAPGTKPRQPLKSVLRKPNPDLGVSKRSALTKDEQLDLDIEEADREGKGLDDRLAARADVDDRLERTITSRLGGI